MEIKGKRAIGRDQEIERWRGKHHNPISRTPTTTTTTSKKQDQPN
jgi:hypothetical protein